MLDACVGTLTCTAYSDPNACVQENFYYNTACGGRATRCQAYCTNIERCFSNVDKAACQSDCSTRLQEKELYSYECATAVYPLYECLSTASCAGLAAYFDPSVTTGYACETQDLAANSQCNPQ